jgi:hypothetical protein
MDHLKGRVLTGNENTALAIMQAYLFQKDHNADASDVLAKLSSEMLAFMDLFSEMLEEDVKQFDKLEIQFVSNNLGELSDLEVVPAYGTEAYFNEVDELNKGPQVNTIDSTYTVAKTLAEKAKSLLKQTTILVSKGGDRILTLSTNKEK